MKVTLIAKTELLLDAVADSMQGFRPDRGGGEGLAEAAGRSCYQSWDRPNPATATNAGYLAHILDVAHLSVLEHGSASYYIEGISRSLSHELVRHRHFSYSQLSQRYVDSNDVQFVMPPEVVGNQEIENIFQASFAGQMDDYSDLMEYLADMLIDEPGSKTEKRKRARQTARAVLGNFTETKIVVTGNYRAWRHFVHMRATAGADTEIRALAIQILRSLQTVVAPNVFSDFVIEPYLDTEIATSSKGAEFE
jgi:thymidylate synthase (FAD)